MLYNGRILPNNSVTIVGRYTEAMLDLTSSTFCIPVIDKNSPIAFSIANDVHWNHNSVKDAGIETTLRNIIKKVYIVEGRSLVKSIKKSLPQQTNNWSCNGTTTWIIHHNSIFILQHSKIANWEWRKSYHSARKRSANIIS